MEEMAGICVLILDGAFKGAADKKGERTENSYANVEIGVGKGFCTMVVDDARGELF